MLSSMPLFAVNVGGPTISDGEVTWLSDDTSGAGFTANFAAAFAIDTDSSTNVSNTNDPSVNFTGRSDNLLDQAMLTLDPKDYTVPDAVFDSWRYDHNGGENLEYLFNVTPGKYRVDLYFSEPTKDAAGKRVFDVQIEGTTVLDNFDIFAETGGQSVAVGRSFVVDSNNSVLDLKLINQTSIAVLQGIRIAEANTDVDRSFNPSTFTATSITQINKGDVVELQPGIYKLSTAELDALLDNSTNQRTNMTLRGVPGQTILDFTDQSDVEWIQFDKWVQGHNNHYTGMTFDGLTFLNAGVNINRGTGFTIQNSIFDGYEGKTHSSSDRVLAIWVTDNATVKNNYIRWNNTSENINAVGMGQGISNIFSSNKVEGLLKKAHRVLESQWRTY